MQQLSFSYLDDLALAVQHRKVSGETHVAAATINRIGPLLELLILGRRDSQEGLGIQYLQSCLAVDCLRRTISTSTSNTNRTDDAIRLGFIATSRDPEAEDQASWIAFCLSMQLAAEFSGLPKAQAQGLVGAMREIEENIHLHSQRPQDGVVGYRATKEEFEFVVADSGIGALASFKLSPQYKNLTDSGTAIQLALTDGESRLRCEDSGRGYGFRGLFVGLANLNGNLRFRSDDHALVIDGDSPSLVAKRLSQTAHLQGFVASVVCRVGAVGKLH